MYASILRMKRTTVFLDEAIERDLKMIAARRQQPMAGVVREALACYVVAEKRAAPTLPGFVAVGRSGHHDTAERHEELLFADLAPPAKTRRR